MSTSYALLWTQLTPQARRALRDSFRSTAATTRPGQPPRPTLPADTHGATTHALRRRGLVDGRWLTPLALAAVRWAAAQPVRGGVESGRLKVGEER